MNDSLISGNGMKAIESENPDPETRIGTACIGRSVSSLRFYNNRNFEGCQGFFNNYDLKKRKLRNLTI